MDISPLVLNFKDFLVSSWPQLEFVMEHLDWDNDSYFIDDWMQANWELIVERQLKGKDFVLPPYGYNVDPKSRCTKVGVTETHRVMCCIGGLKEKKVFLNFVSKKELRTLLEPPFDYVSVIDFDRKNIEVISFENIKFLLVPTLPRGNADHTINHKRT